MSTTSDTLRLGAAQVAEVYLDTEATIEKDCAFIERAGEEGVDLLVFPEFHVARPTWYGFDETAQERGFPEYYRRLYEQAVRVPGPEIDRIRDAAAAAGTAVVLGVTERRTEPVGTMYNAQVFVDADGALAGVRRKLVPTMQERLFHAAGTGEDVSVVESSIGTLGGLMCGEHTNHLLGFALLALGEEAHAASWPAFPWLGREDREDKVGLRTRFHAFAGKVPTALATGVVTDELEAAIGADFASSGGASAIVGPDGRYLSGPKWEGEGIVSADVTFSDRIEGKALHDVVGHYNRFDVFELTVDRSARSSIRFADESGSGTGPVAASSDAVATDGAPANPPLTVEWALEVLADRVRDDEEALAHVAALGDRLTVR